jgi:hypothetical protein
MDSAVPPRAAGVQERAVRFMSNGKGVVRQVPAAFDQLPLEQRLDAPRVWSQRYTLACRTVDISQTLVGSPLL